MARHDGGTFRAVYTVRFKAAVFRQYSLERLLRLLTRLGRDVDIVIRQPSSASGGKLRIAATEAG